MNLNIGKNLKNIRTKQHLSLEDVSKKTGVSKPMLGQIEREQSIPTITTLWKIATGLKTPLSSFLKTNEPSYSLVNVNKENMLIEENGKMRAYSLFPYDPIRNMESFYIEFDSGCEHCSPKHNDGVEEYIFIVKGQLRLVLDDKEIILNERQALQFSADVPHSYINHFNEQCCLYNIIFYSGGNENV